MAPRYLPNPLDSDRGGPGSIVKTYRKHQVDIYIDLSKISAMHEESEEPQKTIEELVPSVISTLVCPMTSREIAASTGLSPATAGNVLKVASSYGLASKALPFNQKRQIWVRAEGDTHAAAQAAWEMRKKRRSTQPLSCETPPSSSINEDFWSRWLRNDPTTRPKLDD